MFQPVHYTLIFHPIKYVSGGNAQPAFIDAFSIYGRIRPYYDHTYNSQRICAAQHWSSTSPRVAYTRVYTRVDGVKIYEESSFRPCKNRPKPNRDIKSGSWNHEVVNKQNVKCESGFSKANTKSGPSFDHDVGNLSTLSKRILSKCYCFAPIAFYCQVMDCELIKTKLSEVSTDTRPSLSAIFNPMNPTQALVSWFHEFRFGFRKSDLNKHVGSRNRFWFWSNQTGPNSYS